LSYPCGKQRVIAVLVSEMGEVIIGENTREHNFKCPRNIMGCKTGYGYALCQEVCKQKFHAEEDVLDKAYWKAKGSKVYIFGHNYACDECKQKMEKMGVLEVVFPNEEK